MIGLVGILEYEKSRPLGVLGKEQGNDDKRYLMDYNTILALHVSQ